MSELSFAIGIPTINRADLLNVYLKKYFLDFKNVKIFILDNGFQEIETRKNNFEIIKFKINNGVAKSWNILCDKIFENHSHSLILNDDIYLGKNEQDIQNCINKNEFDLIRPPKINCLCSFILSKECFKHFRFDENFYPAYYEDTDYLYRLKLESKKIITDKTLQPILYNNSSSIKKDCRLNQCWGKNELYYIKKWGGLKGKETYKTPFNK